MHIVVIGGGVIGLTTAYHPARDGAEVTLLDARKTGLGASSINAGWVVPTEAAPVPGPGVIFSSLKWMLKPDSSLYIRPSLHPQFVSFMAGMWRASNARAQRARSHSPRGQSSRSTTTAPLAWISNCTPRASSWPSPGARISTIT